MIGAGSAAVRRAIEDQPLLSLHGHIHESRGQTAIGRTVAVNPGSEYGEGLLRGAIVTISADTVVNVQMTSGSRREIDDRGATDAASLPGQGLPEAGRFHPRGGRLPRRHGHRAQAQARHERALRAAARQDRRRPLREALDAHARQLPGRHRPPGRTELLLAPRRAADVARRTDLRHGAHHRPLLRRPGHPHLRAGDRRGVRAVDAQPGHQRPHQPDAPLPGPLRPDDDQGEEGRLQGPQGGLPGRHLERLPLADDGLRHDGRRLLRGAAQRELPARRRSARRSAEVGRALRVEDRLHERPRGGRLRAPT